MTSYLRSKKEGRGWVTSLGRNDCISIYKERIDVLNTCQRKLQKIYNDPKTTAMEKIACQRTLAKTEIILIRLYDAVPIVSVLEDYFDNKLLPISSNRPVL